MSRPSPANLALLGLAAFVLLSRFLFLTSSTNMWDSPSYVQKVERMLTTGTVQVFTTLEMAHSLYLQCCALAVRISRVLGGPEDVLWNMKAVGILLTASSVWPFFWLARWLLGTARRGLLAASFYTVIPLLWWWSGEIMSDAAGLVMLVWAFGLLARWLEGRSVIHLALACIVFGANPLVRFSNLSALPLFVLLGALGLVRRPNRQPALCVLLVPLPIILAIGVELFLHPFRSVSDLLAMTPQNELDWGRAFTAERWTETGHLLKVALGPVGAAATALGILAALIQNRRLFGFALLWTGLLLFPQFVLSVPFIRYWLPLMPVAALAIAEGVRLLGRLPRGKALAAGAAAAVAVTSVIHAWPVLRALHGRENALDAVPRWYAARTEPGSLLITGREHNHARLFARGRELLFFVPDVYELSWIEHAHALPETVWRVDRALAANRKAYVSSVIDPADRRNLSDCYTLEEVGRLPGESLRNLFDPGFAHMDERMHRTEDVLLFRLHPKRSRPRGASPPGLATGPDPEGNRLTLWVNFREGAGCLCIPILVERPAALDWSRSGFARDRLLDAGIETCLKNRTYLDRDGRGRMEIEIPRLSGPPPDAIHAGYCIVDGRGLLSFVSVPAKLEKRP